MTLVIDIGNTLTKVAVFKQQELLFTSQYTTLNAALINQLLNDFDIHKAIISTVKAADEDWQAGLGKRIKVEKFHRGMQGRINNRYATPQTLGLDRLAAVIGASHLYPESNTLIIDGGTCITYDYVDAGANYFGGSISPGLNMRYKALNYYTAGLPLIETDTNFTAGFGDSTVTAMQSGVQNGIKYELTGFIESYKKKVDELNVVLCGGDSIFFDTLLKNSIFAPYIKIEPHLVLKGLNAAINNNND